jgi:hypothetical protein
VFLQSDLRWSCERSLPAPALSDRVEKDALRVAGGQGTS